MGKACSQKTHRLLSRLATIRGLAMSIKMAKTISSIRDKILFGCIWHNNEEKIGPTPSSHSRKHIHDPLNLDRNYNHNIDRDTLRGDIGDMSMLSQDEPTPLEKPKLRGVLHQYVFFFSCH